MSKWVDKQAFSKFQEEKKDITTLELINKISPFSIKDKSGLFIGARMGRPEKAKMRKLTGSPQSLFPVGEEGGRLRCFQSALEVNKVKAQFPINQCEKCKKETVYSKCHDCGTKTTRIYHCNTCGNIKECYWIDHRRFFTSKFI